MKARQSGFTLVEIAIVLVIIGLLLGGILKGQEMIVQAKIKNAMADFSGISAAYHGYQDRYRKIPGDDDGAGRWATGTAGSGNGVVAGPYNDNCSGTVTSAKESCLWWQHLRLAGFVAGNGASQPTNAFAGMIGVQTGNGNSVTPGTVMNGYSSLIICSANIPDKVAIAIDTSMDDGVSSTGGVRAELQSAPNPAIGNSSAAYAETGTNIYVMCRQI